jgi:xylulokinase
MVYLGLDIGTSGCRAAAFTAQGRCVASATRTYAVRCPRERWMELDTQEVWNACLDVITKCSAACNDAIRAISVASQGETMFPVDADGQPLAPAIIAFDGRAREQAKRISEMLPELPESTMRPVHGMFSAAKLLWMQEHSPRGSRYMCFGDYAMFMLSGEACIDHSLASRTQLFDIRKKRWITAALRCCGVDESLLSSPVPCGTVLGKIRPEIAKQTGLDSGVRIVAGAHDQACCALAVGADRSGIVMDTLGTTESILCVTRDAVYNDLLRASNIPCDAFLSKDLYAYLGFVTTCGQAVNWYVQTILGGHYGFDELSGAGETPTGIHVLPHFAGSGTPLLRETDKALIYGATVGTTRSELFKAVLEGTAYEARMNLEIIERSGLRTDEIRITGGGARSPIWPGIKAGIYGRSVFISENESSGALGAAMLAAIGLGDVEARETPWARAGRVVEPDAHAAALYDEQYSKYKELYVWIGGME